MISMQRLEELRSELIAKIGDRLDHEKEAFLRQTRIILNGQMRTAAGKAKFSENWVMLNTRLLAMHPSEVEPTFVHEFAHVAARLVFGQKLGAGHGRGWVAMMRMMGADPKRTHDLDCGALARRHRPVAEATCGCPDKKIQIKPRRAKAILNGTRYRCLRCRSTLKIINGDELLLAMLRREIGGSR